MDIVEIEPMFPSANGAERQRADIARASKKNGFAIIGFWRIRLTPPSNGIAFDGSQCCNGLRSASFPKAEGAVMKAANQDEIREAALRMVARYEGKALEEVDLRMRALLVAGELEALQLWSQIREVVRAISTPPPNVLN